MPDAFTFDATTVAPAQPRENTVPDGWYKAWIIDSEMKPTQAGTGHFIELVWECIDGAHKGWKWWTRHNVDNPNEAAVKIAREELSAICHAVGVLKMQHTGQLHGKPCLVKSVIKRQKGYSDKSEIKGYAAAEGDITTPKVGASAPGAVSGRAPALEEKEDDGLPF